MNPPILIFLASIPLALSAGAASSVTVPLIADSFLSGAAAGSNYGAAGALAVSASGIAKGEFQSVLRFDFSSAKVQLDTTYGSGGWAVDSLTLQMTAASPNNAIFNNPSVSGQIAVRWFNDDSWVEGSGTPGVPGSTGVSFSALGGLLASGNESLGSFSYSGLTSGTSLITLNLSSGLLGDIGSGGTASLNLYAGDSTVSGLFNSRSFSTTSSRPILTLNASAVPEPSSLLLGLAGILPMITLRRRVKDV